MLSRAYRRQLSRITTASWFSPFCMSQRVMQAKWGLGGDPSILNEPAVVAVLFYLS